MKTKYLWSITLIVTIIVTIVVVIGVIEGSDDFNKSYQDKMLESIDIFSIVESTEYGSFTSQGYYAILMHNDTGVLYFYHAIGHAESITPLYNEDGTVMTIYQRLEN